MQSLWGLYTRPNSNILIKSGVHVCFNVGWFDLLQISNKVVTIDGYEDVPMFNELALKKAVAHQPVSVAIEAGGRALQLYQSVKEDSFIYNCLCCFSLL